MKDPTIDDVIRLRGALAAMIQAEYDTESSGDSGHYDVSQLAHVIQAREALEATKEFNVKRVETILHGDVVGRIKQIQDQQGYDNFDDALIGVILKGANA